MYPSGSIAEASALLLSRLLPLSQANFQHSQSWSLAVSHLYPTSGEGSIEHAVCPLLTCLSDVNMPRVVNFLEGPDVRLLCPCVVTARAPAALAASPHWGLLPQD